MKKRHLTCAVIGLTTVLSSYAQFSAADAVKEGEELFNQNCTACHQADAIGKPGIAPSLTNKEFLNIVSDAFLIKTINDGRPGTGMAPFKHLGDAKIQAIIAFLRSHEKMPNRAAAVDAEPVNQGDPRQGKLWFDQICSTCHGIKGDGYASGGTGTAIGLKGFLSTASDGFIRETVRNGRSGTRMLSFKSPAALANLTDQEIDDIIAYLRTLQ